MVSETVSDSRFKRGKRGSRNLELGFAIGADCGRFSRGDFAAISRLYSLLVRAGCFFPGGSAVAAVVVPESSVRFGSWEDAGADTSANRTGMAHYYCLTVGILVSERLGLIA